MTIRSLLLASVACAIAAPAIAQEENASDTLAASGEIVVTAQRRAERLADVPIAITALSGDALAKTGIRSTEDLTATVPGLNFATNGAFAQPTVRGIGTTVTSAGNDANVAIYVDGVYQPNQVANFSDLADIEQIEVLKGPQGTLFGRNATGGAIRVTTKAPSWTPSARFSASYGRFEDVRLSAYGTTPLSDQVAVSFAFLYADDAGYVRNIATGNRVADTNALSLRGKALWRASDTVEFTLAASHTERTSNPAFTLGVLNGNSTALRSPGSVPANGPREVSLSFDPTITLDSDQVSLTGKVDLGFAELSSITSYANLKTFLLTDTDRTNLAIGRADIPGRERTWTQEVNLVSQGSDALKWFLGGFYYNDFSTNYTQLNLGSLYNVITLKTEAIAPFGEVNFTTGNLTLIAGARYNIEKKDYSIVRGAAELLRNTTYKTFTPRLGLRYKLSPASMVYATYSKGFKSGGFDGILASGALQVNNVFPEKVDAWEVGYKYGRGTTSLSASAYYYDYSNIQFQAFNPNAGGLSQVFNAAAAEIYGAEIEAATEPLDGLTVRATAAYTHSKYKDFPGASVFCPRGAPTYGNATIPIGALNPCRGTVNLAGATGNGLIRTPEFTASGSFTYRHELDNAGALELSGNAFYSGAFYWDPNNRLREEPYVLLNAELAYDFPGDQFRIAVWGRNLANELYAIYKTEAAAGDSVAYAKPRTYGVSAQVKF
jgi:iron complex outermembrane receptor protein